MVIHKHKNGDLEVKTNVNEIFLSAITYDNPNFSGYFTALDGSQNFILGSKILKFYLQQTDFRFIYRIIPKDEMNLRILQAVKLVDAQNELNILKAHKHLMIWLRNSRLESEYISLRDLNFVPGRFFKKDFKKSSPLFSKIKLVI